MTFEILLKMISFFLNFVWKWWPTRSAGLARALPGSREHELDGVTRDLFLLNLGQPGIHLEGFDLGPCYGLMTVCLFRLLICYWTVTMLHFELLVS